MSTEVFESVWDALEETPTDAENMKLRSSLMIAINEVVSAWGVTQTDAAKRLGVTAASQRSVARPSRQVQPRCASGPRRSRRPRGAFGNHIAA
jgi:predicted XRE-type DNA-binding protein